MTETTLAAARAGDGRAFEDLTAAHRRELLVHCYRILGSVQDAEDVLQETLVAAWDGLRGFEERSSLRTWLYRIATNRALNALRDRRRRPAGPLPDVLLEGVPDDAPGPDARYETKEAVGLAFVSGLQRLPPQQRAALVLRDVLGYRAQEVAEMLGTSTASVTSALQRAREQLERSPARPVGGRLPDVAAERELLGRFSAAFEAGDVDEVVATLTDDAWLRMPPEPHEYQGHAAIAAFLRTRCLRDTRMVATRANGQPAFGYYQPDRHAGVHRIAGILVLTVGADGITALTRFGDTSVLPYFGLPRRL
jgi:RNA polymerase sigma factor (sigma-70 family)